MGLFSRALAWTRGETAQPVELPAVIPAPAKPRSRPQKVTTHSEPDANDPPEIPDYILHAAEVIAHAESVIRPGGKGQPSKLTATRAVSILSDIRIGLDLEPSSLAAGITYQTFINWCDRGEDEMKGAPDGPYATFLCAVKVADAEAERRCVRNMARAGEYPQFWAANARMAESRWPKRWLRVEKPIQVNVGVQVGIQAGDEDRARLLPAVVMQQIASNNADRPALGTAPAHAQTFASPPSLSPESLNSKPVEKAANS